jgi:hypothetical protein
MNQLRKCMMLFKPLIIHTDNNKITEPDSSSTIFRSKMMHFFSSYIHAKGSNRFWLRGWLVACNKSNQARGMQVAPVWLLASVIGPGSRRANSSPQPGSGGTWESAVSAGLGWRGAAVGSRHVKKADGDWTNRQPFTVSTYPASERTDNQSRPFACGEPGLGEPGWLVRHRLGSSGQPITP